MTAKMGRRIDEDTRALPRPPTVGGPEGLGLVDSMKLVRRVMYDPIGMIDDYRAQYGDLFTIPIPFGLTPPFTFLTTREGYGSVLNLDPEIGRNGPIIDRVPALARWTPRSDPSPAHLQTLLLAGRRYIGRCLHERREQALDAAIVGVLRRHTASWPETVDLARALVAAIHETSTRLILGDDLYERLGGDLLDHVRVIVNAVDAARAAIALSPGARLLPEYRSTRALGRRLLALARDREAADRHAFVAGLRELELDGRPFASEDVAWMMFFAIWNATLYTGTYGLWSYLDLLDHPRVLARARALEPGPERARLLEGGVVETMRCNPISWQLRSLAAPVVVERDGERFEVPAGHFLSVFSHGLNRAGDVYPDPLAWKPERYAEGAPPPLLFGTGPFSCVAQRWVKKLIATIHAELIDSLDVELLDPLPARISRVHLLYPSVQVRACIRVRNISQF